MSERRYAVERRLMEELKLTGRICQLLFVLTWRESPRLLRIARIILVVLIVATMSTTGALTAVAPVPPMRGRKPKGATLTRTLDSVDGSSLIKKIAGDRYNRYNGRHGHSPRAIWRVYLASFVLAMPSTNAFIGRLEDDATLRLT